MTELVDSKDNTQKLYDYLDLNIPIEDLQIALIHPSLKNKHPDITTYENYETIGDAVLDLIIVEKIFQKEKNTNPGHLSQERSRLVNNHTFTNVSKQLNMEKYLITEKNYNIQNKDLADSLEAIFGIIYMKNGIEASKKLLEHLWNIFLQNAPQYYDNPKGKLQEYLQKRQDPMPTYQEINRSGSDHQPEFTIKLTISTDNQEIHTIGVGTSIKKSEEKAARLMLQKLKI